MVYITVTVYSPFVMFIDDSVEDEVMDEYNEDEYNEDYYVHECHWVDSRRRITKLGLVTGLVRVNMLNIGILLARFYLDHDNIGYIIKHVGYVIRHDDISFSFHWYLIQHLVHCITYLCFVQFGVVNSPKTLRTLIQQGYAVAFVMQVLVWCVLCIIMVLDKNNLRWIIHLYKQ